MARNLEQKVTTNFTLGELVASGSAERDTDLLAQQHDPPNDVVKNLKYLCKKVLQPLRDEFDFPIEVTSGYRCVELNSSVGGAPSSQHIVGQAADCRVSSRFLTDAATKATRTKIEEEIRLRTGRPVRKDVNANFYLFAKVCLDLNKYDIDQAIHEYGDGPGRPGWVHLAASKGQDRRQILRLGRGVPQEQRRLDVTSALALGTKPKRPTAAAARSAAAETVRTGSYSGQFSVVDGTVVRLRVTAIGVGQFEVVTSPAKLVPGAAGGGAVYDLTVTGSEGAVTRVIVTGVFPAAEERRGGYRIEVGPVGGPVTETLAIIESSSSTYPKRQARTLEFVAA